MSDRYLSDEEIQAEVFRVVRVWQDLPKKSLYAKIQYYLPDVSVERIGEALISLSKRG